MKADDLVAAQCLEERLKAAFDETAQDRPVDLDAADSRRASHLLDGWRANETDLNALCRLVVAHACRLWTPRLPEIGGITCFGCLVLPLRTSCGY